MDAQTAIRNAYTLGQRAAKARRQHDESRASAEREAFRGFRRMYPEATIGLQPAELETHYGDGYRDEMHGVS